MRGAVSMALAYNQVKKDRKAFLLCWNFFFLSICSVMIGLSFLFLNTE